MRFFRVWSWGDFRRGWMKTEWMEIPWEIRSEKQNIRRRFFSEWSLKQIVFETKCSISSQYSSQIENTRNRSRTFMRGIELHENLFDTGNPLSISLELLCRKTTKTSNCKFEENWDMFDAGVFVSSRTLKNSLNISCVTSQYYSILTATATILTVNCAHRGNLKKFIVFLWRKFLVCIFLFHVSMRILDSEL